MQYGYSMHEIGECVGGNDTMCLGQFGIERRALTLQPDNSIVTGCFHGDFKKFKSEVRKKYGRDYGSYSLAVKMIKVIIKERKIKC
jgi:hypothetical protein